MPTLTQAQIAQRNANLDALKAAALKWANIEESRITKESLFIKSILQSRGADLTGYLNLQVGAANLGDEIDRFLTVT